jgi:peptide/nickel transport system ATP-binding protein
MSETLLEVKALEVAFQDRAGARRGSGNANLTALSGVSFSMAPGEILGVVGESGAGKSLTGAAILGLLDERARITAGEVRWAGKRIDPGDERLMRAIRGKEIGAIFQDPLTALNPLMTVGAQLIQTLRTHQTLSRAQARAIAIQWLKDVGIAAAEERIDQYPHQFSGGMRQRVVIALALCTQPRLVIADEPTTALDVSIQAQIVALLRQRAREHGTAVMLITHDMGVIAQTADRVAVMYAGRIVEMGPVAQVIRSPQHPSTIGLMGAIPSIRATDPDETPHRLTQIEGAMPRLDAMPAGCPFHPRCAQAARVPESACQRLRPPLVASRGAELACWWVNPPKGVSFETAAKAETEARTQRATDTPSEALDQPPEKRPMRDMPTDAARPL